MAKTNQYEFLEPDPLWEELDISSQQEYIDKYVIKGKFHSGVPEDVIKDFKIIERLLFYSYYYYPILDEVYSKLTRIFEASINLKIQELNIDVKKYDSLFEKLKLLEPHFSKNLSERFGGVRKLRNNLAHPTAGRLMGITVFNGLYTLCNLLNQIFLDKESTTEYEMKVQNFVMRNKRLQRGLYFLEYRNSKMLIESTLPVAIGGNISSLWVFHPVLKVFPKTKDEYKLTYPLILALKNIKENKNGIKGEELYSNCKIELKRTERQQDIVKHEKFKKQVFESTPEVVKFHMGFVETQINESIEKFMQSERWS